MNKTRAAPGGQGRKRGYGRVFFLVLLLCAGMGGIRAQELIIGSAAEAVEFAVRNSQTWTLRRQNALLNMGAAKMAIQDFLPSFGFSLSESANSAILSGDSRIKSLRFSVSQQIFDAGKTKLVREAGRLAALYGLQEFEGEYRSFLSTIMSLYCQYLLLQEMTRIREDLLVQAGEQLAIFGRETELGLALETDYLEYENSFLEIEQERDQGLRDLAALERRFKAALNLEEGAGLGVTGELSGPEGYFYYEPFFDSLWVLVRDSSTAIKKLSYDVEYGRKQYNYSKRWFLPSVSLEGSVSFSGDSYPLTEPSYSLQFSFSFPGPDFLSTGLSSGGSFDRAGLRQIGNGFSLDLQPLPAYSMTQKQAELNLTESALQLRQAGQELRESLYELVISHDNTLRSAYNTEQRIVLMEKRLSFSRLQLERGEKKRIDYLAELGSLAQAKITLADYLTQAAALERNLEIQTGFPFGGLADACRNH
ncbi:MAG: TolC family protein [Treponema sp.]|jgi:outer membrane protein TolC|nr:TolC family protein [Treponema sp.]